MSEIIRQGGHDRPPDRHRGSGSPPHGGWDGPERRQPDPPDDQIELREVLGILRRRVWIVLLFVALGAGAGYAVAHFQEPQYRANAVVRIDDPRSQMFEGLGGLGAGARSQTDPVLSALEVLRSQTVLGQIVDEVGLRVRVLNGGFHLTELTEIQVLDQAGPDTLTVRFTEEGVEARGRADEDPIRADYGEPVLTSSVRFVVSTRPGVDEVKLRVTERQRAIRSLGGSLRARPREQTDVVDVEFVSPDPVLSQRVVNRAVEVFQERSAEQARRESLRRRAFLEEQLAHADSTLHQTQRALSDFRSREQVFSSREWFAAQQAGLLEIEMRREELTSDRRMFGQLLDGLREADVGDISQRLEAVVAAPEVAQNPVVENLYGQLLQYETARDSLLSGPWRASAESPNVMWTNQQIEQTRGRLERAVRSHMDAVDARIEALLQLQSQTAARIETLPETEAEESRLVQQVESIRRTVEELTSEYYRAQISEAVEEGAVQILDLAPLPLDSEGAGLPLMLALGLMLGLMVGSGGAFLLEMLNTSIRHQADMEDTLQVATVGVIPKIPRGSQRWIPLKGTKEGEDKKGWRFGRRTKPTPKDLLLPAATPTNGGRHKSGSGNGGETSTRSRKGEDPIRLVTHTDHRSSQAEAFRTLRTNLLFTRGEGPEVRTLVVTSAMPGEGKTTTATNLAITYAQQGLRVLVADCDLRRPRIAQAFGIPREPGLTDLVLRRARSSETIHEFGGVEGLHVMGAGAMPDNPTEFLGGARMRKAVKALGIHFDMVILDTPPLSGGADAAILGSTVDGVLMVVRAGQTNRDAARMAARQLHTVGARLVGAVLNDPEGEVPKYGYYYAYQYYGDG